MSGLAVGLGGDAQRREGIHVCRPIHIPILAILSQAEAMYLQLAPQDSKRTSTIRAQRWGRQMILVLPKGSNTVVRLP